MTQSGPILIAYDGSEHARGAITAVAPLLERRQAVVACVWAPLAETASVATLGAPGSLAFAGAEKLDAAARERAEALADEGAALAREAGLDASALALEGEGTPWRALVRCANELSAAAIVTGTRGRSPLAAAVIGSTGQGLLHHAGRPVLVVAATPSG